MRAKILGIILSILGIANLILAFIWINGANGAKYVYALSAWGIFGAILFFMGIRLIPGKNVTKKTVDF